MYYTIDNTQSSPPKQTEYKEINKWDDLPLNINLLRGIYSYGFDEPSAIQKKAILPILDGRDVIAQAQSGTGKTGAFTISALNSIDLSKQEVQVIILAPTHELVNQINKVIQGLSSFMEGFSSKTLLGGSSVQEDIDFLKKSPPHLVVGCTGRVHDLIKRRAFNTAHLKLCILDEADEMLSNGFKDAFYNIFQQIPSSTQIALFSATLPEPILTLTGKFMRDPVRIIMRTEELNLEGIHQYYVAVSNDESKYETLKNIFEELSFTQVIIYANSVNRVVYLYNAMLNEGFSVSCIHSNMTKSERNTILNEFRAGGIRVLISSNLTARGIDVQQVNTVINFDFPRSTETYLHRIGRSGRWGRKGTAINFITRQDFHYMRNTETHYGVKMDEFTCITNTLGNSV